MNRKPNRNSAAGKAFKKVKLKSISQLKREADKIISLYVRQKAADAAGIAECYTCGARKPWRLLQCGHFITRNNSATRYTLNNLRTQCVGCNIWGRGKANVFADKLLAELGTRAFKALLKQGRETHQFTRQELQEVIDTHRT